MAPKQLVVKKQQAVATTWDLKPASPKRLAASVNAALQIVARHGRGSRSGLEDLRKLCNQEASPPAVIALARMVLQEGFRDARQNVKAAERNGHLLSFCHHALRLLCQAVELFPSAYCLLSAAMMAKAVAGRPLLEERKGLLNKLLGLAPPRQVVALPPEHWAPAGMDLQLARLGMWPVDLKYAHLDPVQFNLACLRDYSVTMQAAVDCENRETLVSADDLAATPAMLPLDVALTSGAFLPPAMRVLLADSVDGAYLAERLHFADTLHCAAPEERGGEGAAKLAERQRQQTKRKLMDEEKQTKAKAAKVKEYLKGKLAQASQGGSGSSMVGVLIEQTSVPAPRLLSALDDARKAKGVSDSDYALTRSSLEAMRDGHSTMYSIALGGSGEQQPAAGKQPSMQAASASGSSFTTVDAVAFEYFVSSQLITPDEELVTWLSRKLRSLAPLRAKLAKLNTLDLDAPGPEIKLSRLVEGAMDLPSLGGLPASDDDIAVFIQAGGCGLGVGDVDDDTVEGDAQVGEPPPPPSAGLSLTDGDLPSATVRAFMNNYELVRLEICSLYGEPYDIRALFPDSFESEQAVAEALRGHALVGVLGQGANADAMRSAQSFLDLPTECQLPHMLRTLATDEGRGRILRCYHSLPPQALRGEEEDRVPRLEVIAQLLLALLPAPADFTDEAGQAAVNQARQVMLRGIALGLARLKARGRLAEFCGPFLVLILGRTDMTAVEDIVAPLLRLPLARLSLLYAFLCWYIGNNFYGTLDFLHSSMAEEGFSGEPLPSLHVTAASGSTGVIRLTEEGLRVVSNYAEAGLDMSKTEQVYQGTPAAAEYPLPPTPKCAEWLGEVVSHHALTVLSWKEATRPSPPQDEVPWAVATGKLAATWARLCADMATAVEAFYDIFHNQLRMLITLMEQSQQIVLDEAEGLLRRLDAVMESLEGLVVLGDSIAMELMSLQIEFQALLHSDCLETLHVLLHEGHFEGHGLPLEKVRQSIDKHRVQWHGLSNKADDARKDGIRLVGPPMLRDVRQALDRFGAALKVQDWRTAGTQQAHSMFFRGLEDTVRTLAKRDEKLQFFWKFLATHAEVAAARSGVAVGLICKAAAVPTCQFPLQFMLTHVLPRMWDEEMEGSANQSANEMQEQLLREEEANAAAEQAKAAKKKGKKKGPAKQAAPARPPSEAPEEQQQEEGVGGESAELAPQGEDGDAISALVAARLEAQMAEESRLSEEAAKRRRQQQQQQQQRRHVPVQPLSSSDGSSSRRAQRPSAADLAGQPAAASPSPPPPAPPPAEHAPAAEPPRAPPAGLQTPTVPDAEEEGWQPSRRKGSKGAQGRPHGGTSAALRRPQEALTPASPPRDANGVSTPASAAGVAAGQRAGPASGEGAKAGQRPAAFVSWEGLWRCGRCGVRSALWEGCRKPPGCGRSVAPCADWCFARCADPACGRPHLLFDMSILEGQAQLAERAKLLAQGQRVAEPQSGFLLVPASQPQLPPAKAAAARGPPAAPARPAAPPAAIPRRDPPEPAPAPAPAPGGGASWAQMAASAAVQAAAVAGWDGALSVAPEAFASQAVEDDTDANMPMWLQELGISEAPAQQQEGWDFGAQPAAATPPPPPLRMAWPAPGQDQETAELAAAMQASLQEQQPWRLAGAPAAWAPPLQQQQLQQQQQPSPGGGRHHALAAPGLSNATGEYNCFLNAVVQCLWRCADFRAAVAAWPPGVYGGDGVAGALRNLFAAFAGDDAARALGGARSVVNPGELREALAALPGREFREREMSDAGEVLLTVYERIKGAAEAAGVAGGAGVERAFGLRVTESVTCARCGKTTQESTYTQYLYNTQATAVRLMGLPGRPFGELLREIDAQARKTCDTDAGGCGLPNLVTHFLELPPPRVFTLQLAWESQQEDPEGIAAVMRTVAERVDLGDVYQAVEAGAARYRLRSMVAYYGQHYQALVLEPSRGAWMLYDDAHGSVVGGWEQVAQKCQAGRIQPSVLFYEAERE